MKNYIYNKVETTESSNVDIGDWVINTASNYGFLVKDNNDREVIMGGYKNGKRNVKSIICGICKKTNANINIDGFFICKNCDRLNKINKIKNKIKKL